MWHKTTCWFLLLTAVILSACNKDDTIELSTGKEPQISFENEDLIFTAKIGRQFTLTPEVSNDQGATYSWTTDSDEVISTHKTLEYTFTQEGDIYLTFTVRTSEGEAHEEVLIRVMALTPPSISLPVSSSEGLQLLPSTDYTLTPTIRNREENFRIEWLVDGQVECREESYTFNREKAGSYSLEIVASNNDGELRHGFKIEVVKELPVAVSFDKLHRSQETAARQTLVGRGVSLIPQIRNFKNPRYRWSVNGKQIDGPTDHYVFTPGESGDFTVGVEVCEADARPVALSRYITRGVTVVKAQIAVKVLTESQTQGPRPRNASSSRYQNSVFEYTPAPGQFINEFVRDFTSVVTPEQACDYALKRMDISKEQKTSGFVSLGGFGGYIIVGFDHSILKQDAGYDFSIVANAFEGSSEPGVVWVMQDLNGNGIPDEEWYELRGSESGQASTLRRYRVNYIRPWAAETDVAWNDSEGQHGTIDYMKEYHIQPYYYPMWITEDNYTLSGTRLKAHNTQDANGKWTHPAYGWGYADNLGSDSTAGSDNTTGESQINGFKLSNAMTTDLKAVDLKYIDFVKVQSAVNTKSGWLGEMSTEVCGFIDNAMK